MELHEEGPRLACFHGMRIALRVRVDNGGYIIQLCMRLCKLYGCNKHDGSDRHDCKLFSFQASRDTVVILSLTLAMTTVRALTNWSLT